MTEIKRIVLHDSKTIELALPVYLSDDEIHIADGVYSNRRSAASADAVFLFNIIQKQIEQLMADKEKEKRQPKDDTSHPFADDVLMGGDDK